MGQEKILIVEDESTFALFLKVSLSQMGYSISGVAAMGQRAIDLAIADPPDVILMDINIQGDMDGIETAKKIKTIIDVPIVFLTAHFDSETLQKAKTVTPYGYLVKPFEERSLQATIATAIYKHKMERQLRKEDLNFRNLVETASDGLVIIDENGRYLFSNGKAVEITGYDAQDFHDIRLENLAETSADRECIVTGCLSGSCSATILAKDRDRIHIEVSGVETLWNNRPALMLFIRDLSQLKKIEEEKKELESQLAQAEKVKTLGTLAGGVAHNINNILMAIQGAASLVSLELGASHSQYKYLESIQKYTKIGAGITEQLLGFARGGKYKIQPIDIGELVSSSAEMYGNSRKEVEIHLRISSSPLIIEGDRGQIEQVFLNLYLNAGQAMPKGGNLFLKTSAVQLDQLTCKNYKVEPGDFVNISVADTGVGMDEASCKKMFEPFYTTRKVGHGVGLGLASAYGIIRNHHGFITVTSELGQGTTFEIYLPISNLPVRKKTRPLTSQEEKRRTILIVDDEEMIIDVSRSLLEHLGYRVMTAQGGEQAVECLQEKGEELDLVILDMVMPGMDGEETFDRIREINPSLAVMLSSGYSLDSKASDIMDKGCIDFIKKPFTLAELSDKVTRIFTSTRG